MPVLLTEKDVRAVLVDGRPDRRDGGRRSTSSPPAASASRCGPSSTSATATRSTASCRRSSAAPPALGTKLVSVYHGNAERGPAVAPRDDRPARSRDRRAAGGAGRTLHHRSADGGGLGGLGEAPRARRTRGCWRSSGPACRRAATSTRSRACGRSTKCASGAATRRACGRCWQGVAPHARVARSTAMPSAQRAVDGADVIALVTASREPVLARRRGSRTARTSAPSGACRPDQREMDTALVRTRGCSSTRARARWPRRATS